ncbi:hypothetical protein [Nitrospira moscoviensis]|uniref:hypothetical protein n=1 Tax=Nitrospira moscoviensis TaxID=42253 RepID=UPI0006A7C69E|nr:hypothetical protein [Nitrospira moscoviensis]
MEWACLLLAGAPALAVPIVNDPNGFEGIPWGAAFSEGEHFGKVEDAGRLQTYEIKGTTPALGPVPVDSMRFTTFEGKFGRVTVRYTGKDTHERILTYLQGTYGPLDRTPGQIAVGPVRVYAWHGFDTEVTLRYEAPVARGIIFFESRTLREKLSEGHSATVY